MIRVIDSSNPAKVAHHTYTLTKRMLNPMCGLAQEIGFVKKSKFGANILTAGADIAGVHSLLNQKDPGRGAYHTGGAGIFFNEPIIKSLGETIERYSQLIAEYTERHELIFENYRTMHQQYKNVLDKTFIDLYHQEQLSRSNFPFQAFDEKLPLSWVKAKALNSNEDYYLPAQFVFVGYHIKKHMNEPWYGTAVTTATAAHTDFTSALFGPILEIIQIDSTMGHWYGNYEIPQIIFDERTKPMQSLLNKYANADLNPARFFLLKNPDLLGFSVACILEKPENSIPRVSLGLGAGTSLNEALYKAYLEAIGVSNLSNILILKEALYNNLEKGTQPENIYNIDQNVSMYGKGYHYGSIKKKFNGKITILASDIAADLQGSKEEQFRQLVESFTLSGKELIFIDLTNLEAKELGFYVPRLWCKNTLSLCFPSAAPAKHPRFKKYGGFSHDIPHPYP